MESIFQHTRQSQWLFNHCAPNSKQHFINIIVEHNYIHVAGLVDTFVQVYEACMLFYKAQQINSLHHNAAETCKYIWNLYI